MAWAALSSSSRTRPTLVSTRAEDPCVSAGMISIRNTAAKTIQMIGPLKTFLAFNNSPDLDLLRWARRDHPVRHCALGPLRNGTTGSGHSRTRPRYRGIVYGRGLGVRRSRAVEWLPAPAADGVRSRRAGRGSR
ncbi:hypothetical protein ACFFX0_17610 [Citricoccus parietis]|uniref:Uncharacterized protein n=1 Tax=Citricoccus parietis TaxID=592307 RepID=A0ABV5G1V1_9MICC